MSAAAIMLAVAAVAAVLAVVLLVRLRGALTPPQRTVHLMAGTMAGALALILAIYSTALG